MSTYQQNIHTIYIFTQSIIVKILASSTDPSPFFIMNTYLREPLVEHILLQLNRFINLSDFEDD